MTEHQPVIYEIFCLVSGEKSSFVVDIAENKTVSHLQDAIKSKKANTLANIDANNLTLYRIDLPDDDKVLEQKADQLLDPGPPFEQLKPTRELSDIFQGTPAKKTVHILVRPQNDEITPIGARGTKRKRDEEVAEEQEKLRKLLRVNPSSLAKPSDFKSAAEGVVHCNRPFTENTIPIDLFQPEFGEFKRDCAMAPTQWAQKLLQELTVSACQWYPDENTRKLGIREILNKAGLDLVAEKVNETGYKADGYWKVNIMPPAIRECKNEFGCALFEAIGYYVQFLAFPLASYRHTRFPCILMVDTGPCIAFYGCLFTGEHLHAEPLTPTYDLTTHWTDEVARNAIASSLDAFKKTVARLEEYYQSLTLGSSVARTFPYPTSYKDKKGEEIKFTYRSRIHNKLVFRASIDDSVEDNDLCVKFTKRYSKEAHQFLADLGHAPQLLGVTPLPADWTMVVMEFSQYTQLFNLKLHLSVESRKILTSKIGDIVQKLHEEGFVHGDIRDTNILIDSKTLTDENPSIHLIDFDWAGKNQEVKYPGRVNTVTVRRPDSVSDGELITKDHDRLMVSFLLA